MRHQHIAYDAAETVAYSGSHLAELLAAQSETHVRAAPAVHHVQNVESTVVIAGSSRRLPVSVEEVTGVSWGSTGTGPVAYTLSQPVVVPDRRSGVTRPVAGFLAGVGLLIGLCATPALLAEMPTPGRAIATPVQPREPAKPAVETTPLVSPAHHKVATKRNVRVIVNAVHPVAHPVATVAPPPANEPGEDTQRDDLKLLLAAQAERSL